FARAPVIERHLTARIESRFLQHPIDVGFVRAVEDGRSNGDTTTHLLPELYEAFIVILADWLVAVVVRDQRLDLRPQRFDVAGFAVGVDQFSDLPANTRTGPAEMRLKDLAHIHAA